MPTQTELEFRSTGGGRSQNQILREYFLANPGRIIPMPELAKVITSTGIGAAVHSRVADLRTKFRMNIQHTCDRTSRPYRSFYTYVPGDLQAA